MIGFDHSLAEPPKRVAMKSASNTPAGVTPAGVLFEATKAIIGSSGRRRVRIFGVHENYLVMWSISSVLFAFPIAFFIGLIPVWDRIGAFAPIEQWHAYVAPEIGTYYEYPWQPPRFSGKRVLIAAACMLQLILLGSMVALSARSVRKQCLLVWLCYPRTRLLTYLVISALVFGSCWYIFFFNWQFLAFLNDLPGRGGDLPLYAAVAFPIVTFVFGRLVAIVLIGLCRTSWRKLRRLGRRGPLIRREPPRRQRRHAGSPLPEAPDRRLRRPQS